jgi:hypothetical protein
LAEITFSAVDGGIERDAISNPDTLYAVAGLDHDSGSFMPHNEWRNPPSGAPVVPVNVASADTASLDAHQHVVRPDRRFRHVGDLK